MASKPVVTDIECDGSHRVAYVGVSNHAVASSGYRQPTPEQRLAAASLNGSASDPQSVNGVPPPSTFPAPLVLPGDEVYEDPTYDLQPLGPWARASYRNAVTASRRTLYVVDAPEITPEVSEANEWLRPVVPPKNRPSKSFPSRIPLPSVQDVGDYLAAFYHGLDVKVLPSTHYRLVPWESSSEMLPEGVGRIGFAAPDGSVTRIRHRPSIDAVSLRQLNLLDLLDVLGSTVPQDAYAMVLIVHHDTYEADDDDFCCGRAFGGSRISVVSSFRYHPILDMHGDVEREHAWPASHCLGLVDYMWDQRSAVSEADPTLLFRAEKPDAPMSRALAAATKDVMAPKNSSKAGWAGIWLARLCRTASHELGHCFGLDHCMYYACVMQGVATIAEDARQPPYLCWVCLSKVAYAIVGQAALKGRGEDKEHQRQAKEADWVRERYQKLAAFCEDETRRRVGMWAAFRAWILGRLEELDMAHDNRPRAPEIIIINE